MLIPYRKWTVGSELEGEGQDLQSFSPFTQDGESVQVLQLSHRFCGTKANNLQ